MSDLADCQVQKAGYETIENIDPISGANVEFRASPVSIVLNNVSQSNIRMSNLFCLISFHWAAQNRLLLDEFLFLFEFCVMTKDKLVLLLQFYRMTKGKSALVFEFYLMREDEFVFVFEFHLITKDEFDLDFEL